MSVPTTPAQPATPDELTETSHSQGVAAHIRCAWCHREISCTEHSVRLPQGIGHATDDHCTRKPSCPECHLPEREAHMAARREGLAHHAALKADVAALAPKGAKYTWEQSRDPNKSGLPGLVLTEALRALPAVYCEHGGGGRVVVPGVVFSGRGRARKEVRLHGCTSCNHAAWFGTRDVLLENGLVLIPRHRRAPRPPSPNVRPLRPEFS